MTVLLGVLVFLFVWHYVGYPAVLWLVSSIFGTALPDERDWSDEEHPAISVVVPVHNEADRIRGRIENILAADYPTEKIEVIVASDASTDETVEVARSVSPVVTAFDNTPQNKSATRNMAVERASSDIVLFTDADTRYRPGCLRRLVEALSDPAVGTVCGSLVSESFGEGSIGKGMDLYWRWEYFLRRQQSRLGLVVKSTGANMGLRCEYFQPVPDTVDIDQMAGLTTIDQGGRSLYLPDAVATEQFPTAIEDEFSTRRRLTIRGLTALWRYRSVYRPWKRPLLAVHTVSYWVLRYLVPVLLPAIFAVSLLSTSASPLVAAFAVLQGCFYLLAACGYFLEQTGVSLPVVDIPFSYCWANLGVLVGLVAFLSGTRVTAYNADK